MQKRKIFLKNKFKLQNKKKIFKKLFEKQDSFVRSFFILKKETRVDQKREKKLKKNEDFFCQNFLINQKEYFEKNYQKCLKIISCFTKCVFKTTIDF